MASGASIEKAVLYLTEGKVQVVVHDRESAHFTVEGSRLYNVRFAGFWTCDCPARKAECAHVYAAKLVSPHRSTGTFAFQGDPELDELLGPRTPGQQREDEYDLYIENNEGEEQ